mmetsp:Transcript_4799/g.20555  ORF Transcript_4799/g.20555 Transcript_4799/m.20555 type:complete len:99 (+) Transcript_4799:1457-1753(+)
MLRNLPHCHLRASRPKRAASMGKRKSKARVITVKKPVLAKKFKCPFCCTPDSCEVAFQKLDGMARIECRVCAEKFECTVTSKPHPPPAASLPHVGSLS